MAKKPWLAKNKLQKNGDLLNLHGFHSQNPFGSLLLETATMKPDIHPNYRFVVFKDLASDFAFLTRSTIKTKEKTTWTDGQEYPLVKVEISSHSHPFFTGQQRVMESGGQVDKFRKRFGARAKKA